MIYAVVSLDDQTTEELRKVVVPRVDDNELYQLTDAPSVTLVDFQGTAQGLAKTLGIPDNIHYLIIGLNFYTGRGSGDLANWIEVRNE